MSVFRFDVSTPSKVSKTQQGYLRVDGAITKIGVFEYFTKDGRVRRELRLPDEVFKTDALESFSLAPLTNDHPREPLTAKNTKKYQVGTVANVRQDGEHVAGTILITDEATIAVAEKGKRQLSCGYTCDVEESPGVTLGIEGVPDGLKYDGIQRNILGNHVALVESGRAGPSAALRMDSDAYQIDETETGASPRQQQTPKGDTMETLKIDGVDFEMSTQAAQAVSKIIAKADAATEKVDELKREVNEANQRADKAENELETAKAERADWVSPEKVGEFVKARVELEATAAKIVGDEFKADGKSDDEIKREVVLKVSPSAKEKLDANDAAYLTARFDQAVESFDPKKPAARNDGLNAIKKIDTVDPENRTDANSARKRMIEDSRKLWQTDNRPQGDN